MALGLTLSIALGAAKLAWDNGIRVGWEDDGPQIVLTPVAIEQIPPSGTISVKNINRAIEVDRLAIKFNGCRKGGTKDISCHFSVINNAGDLEFGASRSDSKIVEKGNYIYEARSVKIANGGSSIELYSKIETQVIFTFPGVASDVKKLEVLEVYMESGSWFKIQYRNVPLE